MPQEGRPRAKKPGTTRGTRGHSAPAARPAKPPRRADPRRADPRRTAYDVLAAVHEREAYANLLLPRLLAERRLAGRDAALATELTYGTLRGQGSYDAVLAACSDRPLEKLDPPVLLVLRLGTHQLLSTRVGAHAAVATSVDLAKSVGGPAGLRLRQRGTAPRRDQGPRRLARHRRAKHARPTRTATSRSATAIPAGSSTPTAPPSATPPTPPSPPLTPRPVTPACAGRASPPVTPPRRPAAGRRRRQQSRPACRGRGARGGRGWSPSLRPPWPRATPAPGSPSPTFPAGPPRDEVMPADAEPGRWSPYAFTLASGDPAPLTVESGAAAVQDEGSQLAAIALALRPVAPRRTDPRRRRRRRASATGGPESWLDMCAGPAASPACSTASPPSAARG